MKHKAISKDTTLFIVGLNRRERDILRASVPYSGAGDTYIATYGRHLALAVRELTQLRTRRKAQVYVNRNGDFELSVKPKRA